MPDISMCMQINCPVRDKCYRYLVKPSQRQSYMKPPVVEKCTHFCKIGVNDDVRELNVVDEDVGRILEKFKKELPF